MLKKLLLGIAILVLLLFVPKIINFGGGVILGEPDEFVHADVVKSLINTWVPTYQGTGFYFDLPAYFSVSAVFSYLFFHNPLISLRFVSFMASLFTAFIIYFYLSKKENTKTAILGTILYFLIPLSVFYLRVGVIEPFLVFGMVGTICFFDLGRSQKNVLFSVISGIFLGVSFLTKYSILPVFAIMAAYFVFDFITANRNFYKERFLYVSLYSFIPLVLGLLIFLPVLLYFYKLDPATVKWQTLQVLGLYGGVKQELRLERLMEFPWWFSWPIIIFTIVGIMRSVFKFKRYLFIMICTGAMIFVVLSRLPFYPRYALTLVPFLCIFSALGLSIFKSTRVLAILILILLGINATSIITAYRSSYQKVIEDSVAEVRANGTNPPWAFSNYWPNYFGKEMGIGKFAWLTYDGPDLMAFAPGENRDALTILKTDGGAVFLENLYADLTLTQQPGRVRAIDGVRKDFKPTFTVKSLSPNFPFSKKSGDSIDVYIFNTL